MKKMHKYSKQHIEKYFINENGKNVNKKKSVI